MKKVTKLLLLILMVSSLTSCGYYRDYSRDQNFKDAENRGKSELVEAENSKKALIETARAENEANELIASSRIKLAKADAQAEIERAYGLAKANEILNESLQNSDNYLKYLQIEAIKEAKGTVYIATEAGLPILEARKQQ